MNSHLLLRAFISSTLKNLKKNIHTTSVYNTPDFWEQDKKGTSYSKNYEKNDGEDIWEQESFSSKLKGELKLWKKNFQMLRNEIQEKFDGQTLQFRKGEVDVVWRFSDNPECLEEWIKTADSDNNEGYSIAKLELSSHGTGIFHGKLDTRVPKDGVVVSSGYCNIRTVDYMRSFGRESAMDWSVYTHLRMRVRGDGRFYLINIGMKQTFDIHWFQIYNYILMTRGGPYWQDIKIPFSKFFLTHKGRLQDRQRPVELDKVANIGITCADKVPGPFRLEIDYIGLECDMGDYEEFAYEKYNFENLKL